MSTLSEIILNHARSLPEGGVLSPGRFRHLGSPRTVGRAFARLAEEGRLLRVAPGTYVAPISGRFGTRAPAPIEVIKAMAEARGQVVAPHGASAANTLGLTHQVPIREVFLTSGRTRRLQIGRSEVLLKHAPAWLLALGTGQAGSAVRALAWMGPANADSSVAVLHRTLAEPEWQALTSSGARQVLPSWMAKAIGREAASA